MNKGLIYSTDHGRLCPECGLPAARCCCARMKKEIVRPGDGVARVRYETHGRKGACVTVIRGLPLSEAELERTARKFKQRFGTGGTVHDGVIEIQGDHRGQIVEDLRSAGYTVK